MVPQNSGIQTGLEHRSGSISYGHRQADFCLTQTSYRYFTAALDIRIWVLKCRLGYCATQVLDNGPSIGGHHFQVGISVAA